MKEETKNFTVRIPIRLLDELQTLADQEERTLSGQIKKILKDYLKIKREGKERVHGNKNHD